jgi:hypothetical protein
MPLILPPTVFHAFQIVERRFDRIVFRPTEAETAGSVQGMCVDSDYG